MEALSTCSFLGQYPLQVMLLAAKPLNEPVARYGPFVMNTREEIIEAVNDYNAGRLVQQAE